jgi:hypothetical protein
MRPCTHGNTAQHNSRGGSTHGPDRGRLSRTASSRPTFPERRRV